MLRISRRCEWIGVPTPQVELRVLQVDQTALDRFAVLLLPTTSG
jgi:hypothetical protein